jgi:hypothetical protein
MKPSPTSPVTASIFGPYAATHTSVRLCFAHGRRRLPPLWSIARPLTSPLMSSTDCRRSATETGLPLVTRTAESPRPMPITVRLPYISLSVAKTDAVTVMSRVAGFVTIGPTITLRVSSRILL